LKEEKELLCSIRERKNVLKKERDSGRKKELSKMIREYMNKASC
jgi:hypothetical protein